MSFHQSQDNLQCQQFKYFTLKKNCSKQFKQQLKFIIQTVDEDQLDQFNEEAQEGFMHVLPEIFKWGRKQSQQFYKQFLSNVKIWTTYQLMYRTLPQILVRLSHIRFQQLQYLNISNNFLNNIEPITWLQAPNLKQLYLIDNKISSLKPFRKINNQKLQQLNLYNNLFPTLQIQSLCRSRITKQMMLLELSIHFRIDLGKTNKYLLLTPVFKMESAQIFDLSDIMRYKLLEHRSSPISQIPIQRKFWQRCK